MNTDEDLKDFVVVPSGDKLITHRTEEDDSNSVLISIEPNHESEIYEIRLDGQEVYKE
jgi:hypothetical protein